MSFKICALYDQARMHRDGSTVPIRLQLCDAANNNVSAETIVVTATAVTLVSTNTEGTYALTFTATGDPNPHQVQFQVR